MRLIAQSASEVINVLVPAEDPAIAATLADVDSKLSVFTSAVHEASLSLNGAVSQLADETSAIETSVTPLQPVVDEVVDLPIESDQMSSVVAEESSDDKRESDLSESAESTAENEAILSAAETSVSAQDGVVGQESAPDVTPNKEEALLASLDPETAQAIRVMRRLATSKKSVNELLAEYEATKAKPKTVKAEKKSWFFRGR